MTEPRIGKRGQCSICGHKTDLPRWDGSVKGVRFTLDSRCLGRYQDVCRLIDAKLTDEAAA